MRYMPLRKASITSPSSSIFSSLPSAIHSPSRRSARTRRRRRQRRYVLCDGGHIGRLRALCTLARLELDLRTFGEGLEAVSCDLRVVDEQILATILGRDETVAL